MSVDQDFGGYKCVADNRLTPADFKIVKIEQISRSFLSLFPNDVFYTDLKSLYYCVFQQHANSEDPNLNNDCVFDCQS